LQKYSQNAVLWTFLIADFCSFCCDVRVDISNCDACPAKICSGCFSDQLTSVTEDGWADLSMISRLATLRCDFCKSGSFDAVIRQQLSPEIVKFYVQAVTYNARATATNEARMEKRREQRAYRALPNKKEKEYQTEKETLVEMVVGTMSSLWHPFHRLRGLLLATMLFLLNLVLCSLLRSWRWFLVEIDMP